MKAVCDDEIIRNQFHKIVTKSHIKQERVIFILKGLSNKFLERLYSKKHKVVCSTSVVI